MKDEGEKPENHVQIQTNDGKWHVEETWVTRRYEWWDIGLDAAVEDGGRISATSSVTLTFPPLEEGIHISGLPTLHIYARTGLAMVVKYLPPFTMTT